MNYELALELKTAGFPQKNRNYCDEHPDGSEEGCLINKEENKKPVYTPTLEELIEACGDKFFALEKAATWRAQSATAPVFVERGSTPTEAVARLWLSLNKK